jgi:cellulose synthase/poly-beta-1,6-N-acetylglucosamine synthase-like glycosyltransferase
MWVDVGLAVLSLPVLAWTTYLGVLSVLSIGRQPRWADSGEPRTRFDLVVPAHDEEGGIAATVQSLLAVDYPPTMRRIVVVADNCSDETARRAVAAGATVLERRDASRRGKGYALQFAFERSVATEDVDAVVVVDADTKVAPNLLRAFDVRLRRGAAAVQAEYGVENRDSSWRTRLMHIAFTLFHGVRCRARERLGLSVGLRGNGMAFAVSLLRSVPHDAFSIVEDVEYGVRIGLEGYRVHYAGETGVFGQMVSSGAASESQRRRWEGGRWALASKHATRLVAGGLRRRSPMLLDLAADLLVPPLTYVVLAVGMGLVAEVARRAWLGPGAWWSVAPWIAAALGLMAYVVRGLFLARVGPVVVVDLLWAPVYMVWKVILAARAAPAERATEQEWVRTAREGDRS